MYLTLSCQQKLLHDNKTVWQWHIIVTKCFNEICMSFPIHVSTTKYHLLNMTSLVPNTFSWKDIEGLVQDCRNSIANALELLQSCTKPLIYSLHSLLGGPHLVIVSWSLIVLEGHEGVVVEDDSTTVLEVHVEPGTCNRQGVEYNVYCSAIAGREWGRGQRTDQQQPLYWIYVG